jgi:hypothetical protein
MKIKVSLYPVKHQAMKTYGGEKVLLQAFVTSVLDDTER